MPTETGHPVKIKLKNVFAAKPVNDAESIERIKGLAIQPFIFDLAACQGDIEAQLRHNEFRPNTHYDRDLAAAKSFDRALSEAGYSNRGNPYWVDQTKGEPTIAQIEHIATSAGRCLDTLGDRYRVMSSSAKPKETQALGERMHKFETALEELGFMVGNHQAKAFMRDFADSRPQVVTGPGYMCALE